MEKRWNRRLEACKPEEKIIEGKSWAKDPADLLIQN